MPRQQPGQHDPSSSSPQEPVNESPVAVRHGAAIPAVAGDPGAALAPRGRRQYPGAAAAVTVPRFGEAYGPETTAEAEAEPQSGTEQEQGQEPGGQGIPAQNGPAAEETASESLVAGPAGAEAAGEAPAGTGSNESEAVGPPSAGPKKPMLAAAAIAGALLIAVPFLVLALNDGDKKDPSVNAAPVNGSTTLETEQPGLPGSQYVSESPSASPSHTAKKSPSPSASASAKKSPSPSPSAMPKAGSVGVGGNGSGSGQTTAATPAKTSAPPRNTASVAVQRLAASSPGRHICYRVYVSDMGWQDPVCDGLTAGTGSDSHPISGVDIAVSGTSGTAANAFQQGTGWQQTPWRSSVDGVDLTIGVAKKTPYMRALAVNVGSGSACATAKVTEQGWHGMGCDKPGGYVFAGALEETLWLTALKLTV